MARFGDLWESKPVGRWMVVRLELKGICSRCLPKFYGLKKPPGTLCDIMVAVNDEGEMSHNKGPLAGRLNQ